MANRISHSSVVVFSLTCCFLLGWAVRGQEDVETSEVSGPIVSTDFPPARLPTPTLGWRFADYTFLRDQPVLDVKTGVLELVIKHRPILGITRAQVYWLYRNLAKSISYTLPNNITTTVSLFQLLHPVDHASFVSSTPIVAVNSSLDWIELQMSKCAVSKKSVWNCSDASGKDLRKGFVQGDPEPQWKGLYVPTKVTSTVTQLSIAGYKSIGKAKSPLGELTVSFVSHDFTANGVSLNVTTTIRVGMLKAGSNGEYVFDTSNPSYSVVTAGIKSAFTNNRKITDVAVIGSGMMLHSIQEWQNLRTWLRPVWLENRASLPASVRLTP